MLVDGVMQICAPDSLTLEAAYTRERFFSTVEVIHTLLRTISLII